MEGMNIFRIIVIIYGNYKKFKNRKNHLKEKEQKCDMIELKALAVKPEDIPNSQPMNIETYIPNTTYIVILCFILIIISIILEITKIKKIKQETKAIKKEVVLFTMLLLISVIMLTFFISRQGIIVIKGIEGMIPHGIPNTMLNISVIINVILVVKPLIYILKKDKPNRHNKQ